MDVYPCVIILCLFLWRPTQNNIMKSQHSAYSRERELQRPTFSVLTLTYIFCLEYFWPWYTNWMNLNSCGIRRLNIKCPWHCCRCCLNFRLHFGPSACSVALCSGVGLFFPCLPAHFYTVDSVFIVCSGDICRWFKYILKFRNILKNSEDKSSFGSLMIFKYQRSTTKALEVFQRNTNKSFANNIFRRTGTMLKKISRDNLDIRTTRGIQSLILVIFCLGLIGANLRWVETP